MIQAQIGEQIVGSYLRLIDDCELVSYNQRSREEGHQMEMDVLGVKSTDGEQTVYGCEVVTHLNGMQYSSGNPDGDKWAKFGGNASQITLEKLWAKFYEDYELVQEVFDDADEYVLQLWSPYVPRGNLTDGLEELQQEFREEYGVKIELVINAEYGTRVDKLQKKAASTTKQYDEPVFRFLQILEHIHEK